MSGLKITSRGDKKQSRADKAGQIKPLLNFNVRDECHTFANQARTAPCLCLKYVLRMGIKNNTARDHFAVAHGLRLNHPRAIRSASRQAARADAASCARSRASSIRYRPRAQCRGSTRPLGPTELDLALTWFLCAERTPRTNSARALP